ncbi:Hsp20/alpha crystallin family protein [Halobacterium wangiae]|uniref:Hsp20/alpha crystallin family protein n=1 Tax=Halobacterium wangiae TaxID=2902623 RepID=UPI001E36BE07|nr:Hsp20/alpha crystallin family protein [Halobacterium wangiae]
MTREQDRSPEDPPRNVGSAARSGQPPMEAPPMSGQQQRSSQPSMPPPALGGGESVGSQTPAAVPMVDIVESAEDVVVYIDVPGFGEDQIDIHADANNLFFTADRSEDSVFDEDEGESPLLTERPVRLERRISLPAHIDPEEATATQDDGVCEITVPKDEEERRHEIGFQ